jgi:hypothetical protein
MNEPTLYRAEARRWRRRLTRLGRLGFLFFVLKGMAWLGVAAVAWIAT